MNLFTSLPDFLTEAMSIFVFGLTISTGFLLALPVVDRLTKLVRRNRGDLRKLSPTVFFGDLIEVELDCGTTIGPARIREMAMEVEFTSTLRRLPDFLPLTTEDGRKHFLPVSKIKRMTRVDALR